MVRPPLRQPAPAMAVGSIGRADRPTLAIAGHARHPHRSGSPAPAAGSARLGRCLAPLARPGPTGVGRTPLENPGRPATAGHPAVGRPRRRCRLDRGTRALGAGTGARPALAAALAAAAHHTATPVRHAGRLSGRRFPARPGRTGLAEHARCSRPLPAPVAAGRHGQQVVRSAQRRAGPAAGSAARRPRPDYCCASGC